MLTEQFLKAGSCLPFSLPCLSLPCVRHIVEYLARLKSCSCKVVLRPEAAGFEGTGFGIENYFRL